MLDFSPEALYAVAERAMEQKTGARGLRSIVVYNNKSIFVYTTSNMT